MTLAHSLGFDNLFLHCTHDLVKVQACRAILVERLFAASPDVVTLKRAIRLVLHRLPRAFAEGAGSGDYLHLLAEIIEKVQASVATDVVVFCFEADVFKLMCARPVSDAIREGTADNTRMRTLLMQQFHRTWLVLDHLCCVRRRRRSATSCHVRWPVDPHPSRVPG